MSVKLIATDLDGTLMAPDHITVTPRTYNALMSAHGKGVKIAIATGRTLSFTKNVIQQLPFIDYVVYSNGASVYDRNAGRDIYRNHISPEATQSVLKLLENMPIYYNCYYDGHILVQKDKVEHYQNRDLLPAEFLDLFVSCSEEYDSLCREMKGKSAEIIAMYSVNEAQKHALVKEFKSHSLHITSSLPNEFEVTAPDVNKGTALEGLCRVTGYDLSEIMSFGDALNDREMLEKSGYSFAMGNACEECKKTAKYTALTNAEDGVARAVEEYIL